MEKEQRHATPQKALQILLLWLAEPELCFHIAAQSGVTP